jgi:hypothetical protein
MEDSIHGSVDESGRYTSGNDEQNAAGYHESSLKAGENYGDIFAGCGRK